MQIGLHEQPRLVAHIHAMGQMIQHQQPRRLAHQRLGVHHPQAGVSGSRIAHTRISGQHRRQGRHSKRHHHRRRRHPRPCCGSQICRRQHPIQPRAGQHGTRRADPGEQQEPCRQRAANRPQRGEREQPPKHAARLVFRRLLHRQLRHDRRDRTDQQRRGEEPGQSEAEHGSERMHSRRVQKRRSEPQHRDGKQRRRRAAGQQPRQAEVAAPPIAIRPRKPPAPPVAKRESAENDGDHRRPAVHAHAYIRRKQPSGDDLDHKAKRACQQHRGAVEPGRHPH